MAYISRQGFSFTADELEMANCQITPLN